MLGVFSRTRAWSFLRGALLAPALMLCFLSAGCLSPHDWLYVGRLGYAQLEMSLSSQPLADAIANSPNLTEEERDKLALVAAVKEFSENLGLDTSKVYARYSSASDKKMFLVAASEPLRFEQYLWNWPFVGPLPYKGFFSEDAAEREAESLAAKGFDVYVGRAAGYSTLGWFNDPILPAMLKLDRLSLIQLVMHEATHRNIFKKGHPSFNEGIAVLIARRGAMMFVEQRFGADSPEAEALRKNLAEEHYFDTLVDQLYQKLGAVYDSALPEEGKYAQRRVILARYAPRLANRVEPEKLNNAWILLRRVYTEKLGKYNSVYTAFEGDLARTIAFFRRVATEADNPDKAVDTWLGSWFPSAVVF